MNVYVASDHAGFIAKNKLLAALQSHYTMVDLGPNKLDPGDDYPVYAEKVARAVIDNVGSMGILVCRSGQGMEIAANKIAGIRAAVAWTTDIARETRADNDSNVLSLPAGEVSDDAMVQIARTWLETPFSGAERHMRRLHEIKDIEEKHD